MSDESTSQSEASRDETRVGAGAIALFGILVLTSACLSLMFWILGVGVPWPIHKAMGALFAAINASCFGSGTWFLRKRRRLVAIVLAIAPLPLCVGALWIAVYVFHI